MIVISYYHPIEMLPPAISLIRLLKFRSKDVVYIGVTYTEQTIAVLEELGVKYHLYQRWPVVRFIEHPFLRIWFKCVAWYRHTSFCRSCQRRFLWRSLMKHSSLEKDDLFLWTVNTWVSALWGDGLLPLKRRHIQWLTEYGEEVGRGWAGFSIEKMFETATLIESEINRAMLLQREKKLNIRPFVLPNKPYAHPRTRNIPVSSIGIANIIEGWKGKQVFLYQGSLGADRQGILSIISWLCEAFPSSIVAVMSKWQPIVDEFTKKFRNFSFVPFISAPHHLEVTSYATIGIAIYTANQVAGISPLNGLFCAPNKTFEYAGFGIPLLCNNPPGLRDSVGAANAAVCLDVLTKDSVVSGVERIMDNYESYSINANRYFDSVDVEKIVDSILEFAERK